MLERMRSDSIRAAIRAPARLVNRARSRFAAPSATDNVGYNRFLWDRYAREWDKPETRVHGGDIRTDGEVDYSSFSVVGEEWGLPAEVDEIVGDYVLPYLQKGHVAAEIGAGGGRIAQRVAPHVEQLYCLDIAPGMLERARDALAGQPNVEFVLLESPDLPARFEGALDFIYSFDVFVHLDLHTQWRYLRQISKALRPGGHAFLHTSNLTTDEGWELFSGQERYAVEGFYFVTPQLVQTLVGHTDLELVKNSESGSDNYYLDRDYLIVLRKPSAS
jgi:SAM-dependent methyltransferase